MPGLRILVLSNLFPPNVLGGYEILCGQVCAELERRGHRVTVLTTPSGPDGGMPCPVADVRRDLRLYLELGEPPRMFRGRRHAVGLANRGVARDLVRRERPDVCFAWSQLRLTIGAARGVQDEGVPTLFTMNDEHVAGFAAAPFSAAPRGLARWVLERLVWPDITLRGLDLRHVTCISRCVRDNLVASGVPIEGARIIHQGIPVDAFPCKDDPGSAHDPLRVLYAGQLHAYKGVHTVIEAATLLARRGRTLELRIAGDGPADYRARLERLAGESGVDVRFLGRVPQTALAAMYREHDLFVFPSVWQEPFGLTHLEAMASGTPVLSTADGGHGEFLEDGINALVFAKEDAAGLADRMARLADDEPLRRRLALTAREQVETSYSMTRYVDDLEAMLAEVAGEAR